MDLNDLLTSWVISLRAEHLSRNYVRGCQSSLKNFIAQGYTSFDLRSVQMWLASFSHSSTASVRARHMKRFSMWLLTEGEADHDILEYLKVPTPQDKMVPKVSDEEIRLLFKSCSGNDFRSKRDLALMTLGLSTGIRAQEALDLHLDDIDMHRQIAFIRKGKGSRGRIVPFNAESARAIDRYLRARKKHSQAASEWLWISDKSPKFSYQGFSATMRQRAASVGVNGFHYHRLRHTMASSWLQAGGSEGGLMAVAGWRSRQMIQRYTEDTQMERAIEEARRLQEVR